MNGDLSTMTPSQLGEELLKAWAAEKHYNTDNAIEQTRLVEREEEIERLQRVYVSTLGPLSHLDLPEESQQIAGAVDPTTFAFRIPAESQEDSNSMQDRIDDFKDPNK